MPSNKQHVRPRGPHQGLDFQQLLDAVPDGVVVVDVRGRILLVNTATRRMFGYSADGPVGLPIERLIPEPLRHRHAGHRGPFAAHPHVRQMGEQQEFQALRADGSLFPVEVGLTPIGAGPGATVVAIVRDVSGRRLSEEHHARERDRMAELLGHVQKGDSMGRLAGGIAHDFNNLLTVVTGYYELLLKSAAVGTQERRLLDGIRQVTDLGRTLTRQLLAVSSRRAVQPVATNLNLALELVAAMLARVIGENVRIAVSAAADLKPVVVDQGQMEQVLLNLAVNARDAMPDGGTLLMETSNVHVTEPLHRPSMPELIPPGTYVQLRVVDTGCGMDEVTAAHVFEPFFSTKESSKGTGLGLSIVHGIIRQCAGFVWVESAPGTGTAVTILLPIADAAMPVPQAAAQREAAVHHATLTGTVLLVEDEQAVREMLSEFLASAGYTVWQAADGEQAMAIIEGEAHGPFHLIITDVMMPRMGGQALVQAARERLPGIKVLFISGYGEAAPSLADWDDECTAYIEKPFAYSVLLGRVAELLGR